MKGQVEAVHYIVGADSQVFFKPRSPPILIKSPYYPPTPWVAQVMYRGLAQGLAGQALQWHCALQMLWESYARPGQRYPRSFPKLPSRTSHAPGSNISKVREDKKRYHAQWSDAMSTNPFVMEFYSWLVSGADHCPWLLSNVVGEVWRLHPAAPQNTFNLWSWKARPTCIHLPTFQLLEEPQPKRMEFHHQPATGLTNKAQLFSFDMTSDEQAPKIAQQIWPGFIQGRGSLKVGPRRCSCSQVGSELGLLQCCPKCPNGWGFLETSSANFWGPFAEGDMWNVSFQKRPCEIQDTSPRSGYVHSPIHEIRTTYMRIMPSISLPWWIWTRMSLFWYGAVLKENISP